MNIFPLPDPEALAKPYFAIDNTPKLNTKPSNNDTERYDGF